MSIKRFIFVSLALLLVGAISADSYGATSRELCASSAKEFQKINRLKGYFPEELSDADYDTIRNAGATIRANEEARIKSANIDANTKAISQLVATHAGHIEDRAKGDKVGLIEDVGHFYRFLFLSCRSCHQIYQTEAGLAP